MQQNQPNGLGQAINRSPEVAQALSALDSKCASLEKTVTALITKIQPICRAEQPSKPEISGDSPFETNIANAIAAQSQRVLSAIQRLDDCLGRVEL